MWRVGVRPTAAIERVARAVRSSRGTIPAGGTRVDRTRLSPEDVERALADERATNRLMTSLRPAIQSEIGYALISAATGSKRDARQEIQDLVQEVFITLLKDDAKTLRSWDPTLGRSLEGFVRLVARRYVVGVLRSGVRNPFACTTLSHEVIEARPDGASHIDQKVADRDDLDKLLVKLEQRLTPRSLQLFHLLYVEQRSINEVCELTRTTPAAIYMWKTRFKKELHELQAEGER
jgi:RNA polymerase sigma factor (sigma-70 family)